MLFVGNRRRGAYAHNSAGVRHVNCLIITLMWWKLYISSHTDQHFT